MKLPISNRLQACCSFVRPGDRVADIGCDHGYLGLHLLHCGIASSVIAADVNEGPLQVARTNAAKYDMQDKMSFFLSDGVRNIPQDFDCLVCAGMGADTMISILEAAPWLRDSKYRLIFQCQARRPELRRYLAANGFSISRETLAKDGKFLYTIMEVIYTPSSPLALWDYYITPQLLEDASPLLPAFVHRVVGGLESAAKGLARTGGDPQSELIQVLNHLQELERSLSHDNCC